MDRRRGGVANGNNYPTGSTVLADSESESFLFLKQNVPSSEKLAHSISIPDRSLLSLLNLE